MEEPLRYRAAVGLALSVLALSLLAACGPRQLSALGNPGDLCTERTACAEGTECRITEEGYRCVGRDGRVPGGGSPGFTSSPLDEEGAGGIATETSPEVDDPDEPGTVRRRDRSGSEID